jgi:hypothetical protein
VQEALDVLLSEGRVQASDAGFRAAAFVIEEDSEHGWEAAAFDHFQAVAKALANKVYLRSRNSEGAKLVSGTTLHFDLTADHPLLPKVLGLLAQTRELTDAVWDEVFRYNELHAVPDENRVSLAAPGPDGTFDLVIDNVGFIVAGGPKTTPTGSSLRRPCRRVRYGRSWRGR